MSEGLPEDFHRALVMVAHPDDAEFGCGGTVAQWTGRGVEVTYLVCTDGARGIMARLPEVVEPDELRATRRREQEEAARALGVRYVEFLGHPDGELAPNAGLKRELVRAIRRFRPDVVVCQNSVRHYADLDSNHPDHLAAGTAAIEAIYPAAHSPAYYPELLAEGLEPHTIRWIWVMGTAAPNHFLEVEDTLERKLEAVRCHRSQYREDPGPQLSEQMAELGRPRGLSFAEGFSVLRGRL